MKDSSSLRLPLESLVALQNRGLLLAPFTYLETITESMVKLFIIIDFPLKLESDLKHFLVRQASEH